MSDRIRLVDEEFEDEPLNSDQEVTISHNNNVMNKITTTTKNMGTLGQLLVFMMCWLLIMGIMMIFVHIVTKHTVNNQVVMAISMGIGWIAISNLMCFTCFFIDKVKVASGSQQIENTVPIALMGIGGWLGGWLGVCLTVYKPPLGTKFSGFFGRALFATAFGIAIDVFIILRILLPNRHEVESLLNNSN